MSKTLKELVEEGEEAFRRGEVTPLEDLRQERAYEKALEESRDRQVSRERDAGER